MEKLSKIENFNINNLSEANSNLFGLPFSKEESDTVVIPVPWEVTVSYREGTSESPNKILEASHQVDLIDPFVDDAWKFGVFMEEIDSNIKNLSNDLRKISKEVIKQQELGEIPNELDLIKINKGCEKMNLLIKEKSLKVIRSGKTPAVLGGDHSTPLGLISALSDSGEEFTILQIDSHCDLREEFEGFKYSHASVMFNAIELSGVKKLVQVGIRDYCEEELELIENSNKIETIFDRDIKRMKYIGKTWDSICSDIVSKLTKNVYLSFDIDGLDPKLCPGTGTPVPGGFEMEEILYLLEKCVISGIKFIGFDLNEVSGTEEINYIVASRLLWRISNLVRYSQNEKVD